MLILLLSLAATGPDLTLAGVVTAQSGHHAATLVSEGRRRSVVAGEKAFGCDVVAIRAEEVDITCHGERRTLSLVASAAPFTAPDTSTTPPVEEAPADLTFNRVDLEARLDREMSRLVTETTLVPVTSRGRVAGFTLSRVPAGTILETLGLKAGDVLVSVNETPIDSFTTLVGLWPRLQQSPTIRAEILRDGRPLDISVSIR